MPTKTKPGSSGNLQSNLLLTASSLFVAFLLAEIALRALGISYPSETKVVKQKVKKIMRNNFYRAFSYTPNNEWLYTREGRSHVAINSEGFNDRVRELKKPPGYFRIAVLGDSYTAALQVERKRRFTETLEKKLNQRKCYSSGNVEVLNFGVSDYGTAQELMLLRHNVWRYNPDMVTLAFWPANDLNDNSKELSRHQRRPFGVIRNGKLEFDNSFRSLQNIDHSETKSIEHVIDRSRVFQLVGRAYRKLHRVIARQMGRKEKKMEKKETEEFTTLLELAQSPRAFSIYHESSDEKRKQSWQITDALISLVNQETRENGAIFFTVSLGTQLQVTPDISVREKLLQKTGSDTLFYPGNRLKAIGRREGFGVLDLAPHFQQFADKHQVFLHGIIDDGGQKKPFGHWTEQGHQLAAQIISEELCETL